MKAELLLDERRVLSETAFVELVIWRLLKPKAGCDHCFSYRLALVWEGVCVLRYDNERGKGDHKHVGGIEAPYRFVDCDTLLADFRVDVESWRRSLP